MSEEKDAVQRMIERAEEMIASGRLSTRDRVEVRAEVMEGTLRFVNVPHTTFYDSSDPRWYCVTNEAEKVLAAYLNHSTVVTDGEALTIDYDDVEKTVIESGMLSR